MRISEDEKEKLVELFRQMLDNGEECCIFEIMRVEDFFIRRTAFRVSVSKLTETR